MDPAHLCREHGGTARWSDLRASGVTRTDLRLALEAQSIFRIARGTYAVPSTPTTAMLESAWRGRATCVTALRAWGVPAPTVDSRAHIAIPSTRSPGTARRNAQDVRLHWFDGPIPTAGTVLGALDVASLCVPDMDQLAALDAALNQGLITRGDLDRLRVTPPSRSAWLREHCDPTCQSPPETFARVAMREAGLEVRAQVQLPGVGRVDFVVDQTVVVEIDGKTYHMDEGAFWEDRRRDRVTQLGTRIALRFTAEDVDRNLAGLVREVAGAVAVQRERSGRAPLVIRRSRPAVPWSGARAWSSGRVRR